MRHGTTDKQTQKQQAERFRMWHAGDDILVLPCAWDVASAKVFEAEGFKAIGTTSAGIAAALGYPDGQKIDFQEYLRVIRKIVTAVQVPVSVDVEAGFATTVPDVAANMKEVLHAGAVGINIEDENHTRSGGLLLEPVPFMVEKIQAIRAMGDAFGVSIFINAKTDAVWLSAADGAEASFQEAVDRANAYGSAGADCVFIPGDFDLPAVTRLAEAVRYPLNIVIKATTPAVPLLSRLGIKRLSMGSGPMRAAMGLTRKVAREVLANGTYQSCLELEIPYAEVKRMFDG